MMLALMDGALMVPMPVRAWIVGVDDVLPMPMPLSTVVMVPKFDVMLPEMRENGAIT